MNRKQSKHERRNTMFPGRANYVGPRTGAFGLLHHDQLYETSHDVMERVAYVKREKPENEIATRLHNMIYLGDCSATAKRDALHTDYWAKCGALKADYQAECALLDAGYWAKRAPLDVDYRAKYGALAADYQAKCDALYTDCRAKRALLDAKIMAYIKLYISDCAWSGEELVFARAEGK